MGWSWPEYRPQITARLSEHCGERDERDHQLWAEFTAEADAALKALCLSDKYKQLELYHDYTPVNEAAKK